MGLPSAVALCWRPNVAVAASSVTVSGVNARLALNWPLDAIRVDLAELLPDLAVEAVPSIDSTNTELMRRLRSGDAAPVLLVAEQQSAGRGRLGRQWVSGLTTQGTEPQGQASLTFSLSLPLAPVDWSGLSLAVGVALAQALHPDLRLKWPNDLWWQQRKLGGILVETASWGASRYVVVGVGLNLLQPPPAGLSTAPAWLGELLPGVDAPAVLRRVAGPLALALRQFERSGFASFQPAFQALDGLSGQPVVLSSGASGIAQGVDPRGALLVHTPEGVQAVNSAEVSVRAAPRT